MQYQGESIHHATCGNYPNPSILLYPIITAFLFSYSIACLELFIENSNPIKNLSLFSCMYVCVQNYCCFSKSVGINELTLAHSILYMDTRKLCMMEENRKLLSSHHTNETIILGTRRISGFGGTGLQQGASAVPRRCVGSWEL